MRLIDQLFPSWRFFAHKTSAQISFVRWEKRSRSGALFKRLWSTQGHLSDDFILRSPHIVGDWKTSPSGSNWLLIEWWMRLPVSNDSEAFSSFFSGENFNASASALVLWCEKTCALAHGSADLNKCPCSEPGLALENAFHRSLAFYHDYRCWLCDNKRNDDDDCWLNENYLSACMLEPLCKVVAIWQQCSANGATSSSRVKPRNEKWHFTRFDDHIECFPAFWLNAFELSH